MFRGKKDKGKKDKGKNDNKQEDAKKSSTELNLEPVVKEPPKLSPRAERVEETKKESTTPRLESPKSQKGGLFGLFKSKSADADKPKSDKEENEKEDTGVQQVTFVREDNTETPPPLDINSEVSSSSLNEGLTSDDSSLSLQSEGSLSSLSEGPRGVSIDRREELRKRNLGGRKKANNTNTVVGRGRTLRFAPEEVQEKPEDYEEAFLDFEKKNIGTIRRKKSVAKISLKDLLKEEFDNEESSRESSKQDLSVSENEEYIPKTIGRRGKLSRTSGSKLDISQISFSALESAKSLIEGDGQLTPGRTRSLVVTEPSIAIAELSTSHPDKEVVIEKATIVGDAGVVAELLGTAISDKTLEMALEGLKVEETQTVGPTPGDDAESKPEEVRAEEQEELDFESLRAGALGLEFQAEELKTPRGEEQTEELRTETPQVESKGEEPKADEPKDEEPKSEELTATEPQVDEEPKVEDRVEIEELKAEEPKSEEPKPEELKATEPETEEPKVEELKAEEFKAEELRAEEPNAEERKAEELKAEEPKAEEPKAEEPKAAEEPNAEEPKAEEPEVEEPKAEEPKAEETKAEEPKAEEPKTEEPEVNAEEPSATQATVDTAEPSPREEIKTEEPSVKVEETKVEEKISGEAEVKPAEEIKAEEPQVEVPVSVEVEETKVEEKPEKVEVKKAEDVAPLAESKVEDKAIPAPNEEQPAKTENEEEGEEGEEGEEEIELGELLYKTGEFVAIRTGDDPFWLARLEEDVYENMDVAVGTWLDAKDRKGGYAEHSVGDVDVATIIFAINMRPMKGGFRLSKPEKDRILKQIEDFEIQEAIAEAEEEYKTPQQVDNSIPTSEPIKAAEKAQVEPVKEVPVAVVPQEAAQTDAVAQVIIAEEIVAEVKEIIDEVIKPEVQEKPEEKPEAKPEEKPEVKPEEKPEEIPEVKPEEKPEEIPEEKPEVKPEEVKTTEEIVPAKSADEPPKSVVISEGEAAPKVPVPEQLEEVKKVLLDPASKPAAPRERPEWLSKVKSMFAEPIKQPARPVKAVLKGKPAFNRLGSMSSIEVKKKRVAATLRPLKRQDSMVAKKVVFHEWSSLKTDKGFSKWELQALERWNEFIGTYKKAQSAAREHKEKVELDDKQKVDAEKIIGALKHIGGPPPALPAPAPEAPPPPPLPLADKLKQNETVNIFKFSEVEFGDMFGDIDDEIKVWKVQEFGLEPIPDEEFGNFYINFSYLVLHTSGDDEAKEYAIHIWLGDISKKRPIERGTCAMMAVQLNSYVGGAAKMLRQEQGIETEEFHKVFSSFGVNYLEGEDPPKKARFEPLVLDTALYKVVDTGPVFVKHVLLSQESLTSDSSCVFVVKDAGKVYQWNGKSASLKQKLRARRFASKLKTYFVMKVQMVEFAEGQEPQAFFDLLKEKEVVPVAKKTSSKNSKTDDDNDDEASGNDDETSDNDDEEEKEEKESGESEGEEDEEDIITMQCVTDVGGKLELKNIDLDPPFSHELVVNSSDVYILDCTTDIFVYRGGNVSQRKKFAGQQFAKYIFVNYMRPSWAKIWDVVSGAEPPFFTEHFKNWPEPKVTTDNPLASLMIPSKEMLKAVTLRKVEAKKLIEQEVDKYFKEEIFEHVKRDRKVGDVHPDVQIWSLAHKGRKFVKPTGVDRFQLYRKDCSLVLATWHADESNNYTPRVELYWWQGSEAEGNAFQRFNFDMYQVLSKKLVADGYAKPECIVINEHKEEPNFSELFGGKIIIHRGSRTQPDVGPNGRLYSLRKTSTFTTHLTQVDMDCKNFHSGDVMILIGFTPLSPEQQTIVWYGAKADVTLRKDASSYVRIIASGVRDENITYVEEGSEPEGFWPGVGSRSGTSGYPETGPEFVAKYGAHQPRLFRCVYDNNKTQTVPVPRPIWTTDLDKSSFQILDTYHEIYTWKGPDVPGTLDVYAKDWLEHYVKRASELRGTDVPLKNAIPYKETLEFTRHFHAWFRPITSEDELEAKRQKTIDALAIEYQKELEIRAVAEQKAADEANELRLKLKAERERLEAEAEAAKAAANSSDADEE